MTTVILFLRRFPHLRPSLPLTNLTTSFYSLHSSATTTTQAPPPNPQFAVEYLTFTCGLPSEDAIRASKQIQHRFKSSYNPDAVLRFVRQIGIRESEIRAAVSRDPRLLCSDVENNFRPNVAKQQEIGLSIEVLVSFLATLGRFFCSILCQRLPSGCGLLSH